VTRWGFRRSKSAPCGSFAGAEASGENAVIGQSQVDRSRGRLFAQRGLTQNLRHLHQQNDSMQQMRRISWPGGRLLAAPMSGCIDHSSIRIQTHHSSATGTIARANTARL